jgi:hypothetical protein
MKPTPAVSFALLALALMSLSACTTMDSALSASGGDARASYTMAGDVDCLWKTDINCPVGGQ